MSLRGWGGAVGTAAGVAAGTAAAQAGLGYGLGVIVWLPTPAEAAEPTWVASLTWAIWIAATSTVAGALGAARLAGPTAAPAGWPRRCALAVAATVGGCLSVALIAVPAREASGVVDPGSQQIAAGYALAGVGLGLLLALWALSVQAVARNLLATIVWIWTLAVAAVVVTVVAGRVPTGAPLGSWPDWAAGSGAWFRDLVFWPAAVLSLGSALVIGVLAAWSVARDPQRRVGAAISGGVGPAVAAAAYLLAPLPDGVGPEQISANLTAPYVVIAGLAGSALAAGLAQRRSARDVPPDVDSGVFDPAASAVFDAAAEVGVAGPGLAETGGADVGGMDAGGASISGADPGGAKGGTTGAEPSETALPKASPTEPKAAETKATGTKATGTKRTRSKRAGATTAETSTARIGPAEGLGPAETVPDQRSSPDGRE